jgi:hypothetical protein
LECRLIEQAEVPEMSATYVSARLVVQYIQSEKTLHIPETKIATTKGNKNAAQMDFVPAWKAPVNQ